LEGGKEIWTEKRDNLDQKSIHSVSMLLKQTQQGPNKRYPTTPRGWTKTSGAFEFPLRGGNILVRSQRRGGCSQANTSRLRRKGTSSGKGGTDKGRSRQKMYLKGKDSLKLGHPEKRGVDEKSGSSALGIQ